MNQERQKTIMQTIRFGLYFFIFLLTESLINDRTAVICGVANVNYVYSCGLIFTALGYLCFAIIKEFSKRMALAAGFLSICTIIGVMKLPAPILFLPFSFLNLFSLGMLGGYIHYRTSLELPKKHCAVYLGIFSMLGILLQFIVQNMGLSDNGYTAAIHIITVLMMAMSLCCDDKCSDELPVQSIPLSGIDIRTRTWVCIISVAIMSIILGFQDSLIVIKNAADELHLFSYVRLFYAFGLLIAGIIADIKNRLYLPLATGCAMTLSVLAISFMDNSNVSYNISMGIMYFYCGFYVMFMTVMFMDLGLRRKNPKQYAGLGRVIRSIITCIAVLLTTMLSHRIGLCTYIVLSCVLSIGLLILMALTGILLPEKTVIQEIPVFPKELTFEEKLTEIYEKYAFTEREKETFRRLITTEMGVQEIADEMGISRRVLQRHIASLYDKTNTQTRIGLLMLLTSMQSF